MPDNKINLNATSIVNKLAVAAAVLILTSSILVAADYLTGQNSVVLHKLVKLFYVELELNIPAFFSMSLLLTASLLLLLIAVLTKKQGGSRVFEWTILASGFFVMAFDEIIAVHERLIEPMRAVLGGENLGILYFAWVVPAVGLVLFLGLCFFKFLMNLPKRTRFLFLIAAALYLGAAIGFEFIEGSYVEIYGKNNLIYIALTTIEEALEMAGITIFIRGLLSHIAEIFGEVNLRFSDLSA